MCRISVIVPVYNVAPYLTDCIDSVLRQTFSDFELILVDDGSADDSSEICDRYAVKDSRVIVIHQQNSGAAAARNKGLDIARGQYVMFIDSDDWVEVDIIESLYQLMVKTGSDISSCVSVHEFCGFSKYIRAGARDMELTTDAALKELMYEKNTFVGPYAKLFKKDLFADIRFPKMNLGEDFAVMYRLFGAAKKIAFSSAAKYHYRQRRGSASKVFSDTISEAYIFAAKQMMSYIDMNYLSVKNAAIFRYAMVNYAVCVHGQKKSAKQSAGNIRKCFKIIWGNNEISRQQKLKLASACLPRPVFRLAYALRAMLSKEKSEVAMWA